jgi:dolichyl-phosphate-mannose-protein mannosyltransferase
VGTLRRFLSRPAVALVLVGLAAGWLRFYDLDDPPTRVFDEVYYSKAGCLFVGYSWARCDIIEDNERTFARDYHDVGSWVHPPLGKWAIGLGELVAGTGAVGWRFSAAMAGTLTVVLLAWLVFLLWRSVVWTYVAGVLLATEGLHFVQSRTSMLDVFLALWVLLGFVFLVLDCRWIQRRTLPVAGAPSLMGRGESPPSPLPSRQGGVAVATAEAPVVVAERPLPSPIRPWRLAAGAAFGAGVATKWSGLAPLAGAIVLSLIWERTRRRNAGQDAPLWRALVQESFGIVLALLFLPVIVYVLSWAGHFVWLGWSPVEWARHQGAMISYHRDLDTIQNGKPIHPYLSDAWQWIVMARPVVYFYEETGGTREEIIGMGNPVVFWASVVAIPYAAVMWCRRRDWIAGLVVVGIVAQYLPWFLIPRPQFFFYMTPVVPFLVLAIVYLLRGLSRAHVEEIEGEDIRSARPWAPVVVLVVALAVGAFAFFWPVLVGAPLSDSAWESRIWFDGQWWSPFNWV